MRRISVDKKDGAPKIVEKMLESPDTEIVLIIPAGSNLKNSTSSIDLLKREAEAAGKRISVESVDKEVLALARKAKLEAAHPLFKDERGSRSMSDIVPADASRSESEQIGAPAEKREKRRKERAAYEVPNEASKKEARGESRHTKAEIEKEQEEGFPPEISGEEPRAVPRKVKIFGGIVIVALVALGAGWAGGKVFGKAEVVITFKKTPWQFDGAFSGSKVFAKIDADKRTLPAEAFFQNKNGTWLFPASGRSQVSQKATGKVTIYNNYSAAPQTLVATTRFMTADGKIFRLNSRVTVPGARIQNGKIAASRITANVTADKAGEEYNVAADRLAIPGFKGTPRYSGFYAAMPQAASGGFAGNTAVPTDKDIAAAKDKATQNLKNALQLAFESNRPEGFTILDAASQIQITKLVNTKVADKNGDFTVFGEAQFKAVGFRESDVKAILAVLADKDMPGGTFRDLELTYSNVKPNFDAGQIGFSVNAQGTLEPAFSADDFKAKIAGHSVNEARQMILALPDLTSAKISLLPFWLSILPSNPKRITIDSD